MKNRFFPLLLALAGGAAAFALRWMQDRTGFEADTGLDVPGNLYARLLPAVLAVLAVLLVLALRRVPSEKDGSALPFSACFSAGGAAP